MLYYRVKIGFSADDFISIGQDELQKALRAQVNGGVVIFGNGSIAGNNIISITPDWNRFLGLNRDYKLTGEDYRQIDRNTVNISRKLLSEAKMTVTGPEKKLLSND